MGSANKFFSSLFGAFRMRDQKAAISAGQVKPVSGPSVSESEAKAQLRDRRVGAVGSAVLGAQGSGGALGGKSKLGK